MLLRPAELDHLGLAAALRGPARRGRSRRPRSPRSSPSCSRARSRGRCGRVAEATRGLAERRPTPPPVPVEGPARARPPRRELQRGRRRSSAKAREAEQRLPPLRQPRAEDAADRDPRLRRGARGRRAAGRGGGGDDRRASRSGSSGSSATCSTSAGCARPSSASAASRSTWPRSRTEAFRRYETQARDFGVDARGLAAAEPAPALGDADRMLQVVSNLVENALRLTRGRRHGPDRRRARRDPRSRTRAPGCGPTSCERAFERFYLYSRYGRERPVGTGLGLAIVKELAEGMGGASRRERAGHSRLHGAAAAVRSTACRAARLR